LCDKTHFVRNLAIFKYMAELNNFREVGVFDLLSAPLNPIGAFDAEQFKKDVRALIDSHPDDKFVAVDLIGLDFVYSDAYNAFLQFQAELSNKGGMLALLSNSATIMDGLKKAGLDRKLKIFAAEADMMSFSLHSQAPQEEEAAPHVEESRPKAVTSRNVHSGNAVSDSSESKSLDRKTGTHRRFTKSFNAIVKDEKKLAKKGMAMPFEEEKSSSATIVIIITVLIVLGGLAAFLLLR